jgi:hypothetical protein
LGGGRRWGKGCKRVNIVQILCTHICKWKNEMGVREIKENGEGDEFKYDIFD